MEDENIAAESLPLFYNVSFTIIPTGLDPVLVETVGKHPHAFASRIC